MTDLELVELNAALATAMGEPKLKTAVIAGHSWWKFRGELMEEPPPFVFDAGVFQHVLDEIEERGAGWHYVHALGEIVFSSIWRDTAENDNREVWLLMRSSLEQKGRAALLVLTTFPNGMR